MCLPILLQASGIVYRCDNQALFGFGDAVCVNVVEWIGKNYLNKIWEEEFAPNSDPVPESSPVVYCNPQRVRIAQ